MYKEFPFHHYIQITYIMYLLLNNIIKYSNIIIDNKINTNKLTIIDHNDPYSFSNFINKFYLLDFLLYTFKLQLSINTSYQFNSKQDLFHFFNNNNALSMFISYNIKLFEYFLLTPFTYSIGFNVTLTTNYNQEIELLFILPVHLIDYFLPSLIFVINNTTNIYIIHNKYAFLKSIYINLFLIQEYIFIFPENLKFMYPLIPGLLKELNMMLPININNSNYRSWGELVYQNDKLYEILNNDTRYIINNTQVIFTNNLYNIYTINVLVYKFHENTWKFYVSFTDTFDPLRLKHESYPWSDSFIRTFYTFTSFSSFYIRGEHIKQEPFELLLK